MATLWSINGLSAELGIDRRTLSKKLADLRPDGEGIEGGKTVRRWHLMHALKHLQAADRATAAEGQDVHAERARLVRARARKAELEVAALERDLLPVRSDHPRPGSSSSRRSGPGVWPCRRSSRRDWR